MLNITPRPYPHIVLVLVIFLTVLMYLPGLNSGFLFDDSHTIQNNKHIQIDSLQLDGLYRAAWSFAGGGLKRPVSMLSLAINHYYFGISPYAYKAVNLGIHILTGILIYLLSILIINRITILRDAPLVSRHTHWYALALTTMWLISPINLTTILYPSQRMTGLASLFMVMAILVYTYARAHKKDSRFNLIFTYPTTLLVTLLAALSKEIGLLVFPLLFIIELTLFRFRSGRGGLCKLTIFFFFSTLFAPLLTGAILLYKYSHYYLGAYNSSRDFGLFERLMTEARILLQYIQMIVMPNNQNLGLWHDDIAISRNLLIPASTLPAISSIAILFLAAVRFLKTNPLLSLGIFWLMVAHALESTILPLELAHEHRNYLASYGILLVLVAMIPAITSQGKARIAIPVIIVYCALLGITTYMRAVQWSDPVSRTTSEARYHPESARAQFAAGQMYFNIAEKGIHDAIEPGVKYMEKAVLLNKRGINPEISLIMSHDILGIELRQSWHDSIIYKLQRYPITWEGISALRVLWLCQQDGSCHIPHERVLEYLTLAANKGNAEAFSILAFYYANILNDHDAANTSFLNAIRLYPDNPVYHINIARLLISDNKIDAASSHLDIARTHDIYGLHAQDISRLKLNTENH